MSQDNVDLIRGAYEAFNRGDIDAVVATMDEGIEWHEPGGGNAPAGTFRGPQSVANDLFSQVPENFDEFVVDTEQFFDIGEHVAVLGRFRGTSKRGKEVDIPFVHVATVRDGKEVEFRNYVTRDEWAEAWA